LNILDTFSKNTQISNLLTIRTVGVALFLAERHTGGRTDIRVWS